MEELIDALEESLDLVAKELLEEKNKNRVLTEVNRQLTQKLTDLMVERTELIGKLGMEYLDASL